MRKTDFKTFKYEVPTISDNPVISLKETELYRICENLYNPKITIDGKVINAIMRKFLSVEFLHRLMDVATGGVKGKQSEKINEAYQKAISILNKLLQDESIYKRNKVTIQNDVDKLKTTKLKGISEESLKEIHKVKEVFERSKIEEIKEGTSE